MPLYILEAVQLSLRIPQRRRLYLFESKGLVLKKIEEF